MKERKKEKRMNERKKEAKIMNRKEKENGWMRKYIKSL